MKTEPQNQTSSTTATPTAPTSAPRRHMRRRCTNSNLSSSPSAPSASSALQENQSNQACAACPKSEIKNQKSEIPQRRQRSRPFQPLPEFAHLRPDQLDFIHDLFRTRTLEDIKQQLYMDLGANLSIATLHRYRAQLDLADQLQIAENLADNVAENATDTQSPVDHLRDLYAARPTQLDAAGLQVIKQRALELAASPKTSPSLFKDLHRIFTYEDRKQEKQNTLALRHTQRLELAHLREQTRLQIANQREASRQRQLDLAQKRYELELRKQEHREKLDAANAPQKSSNDEAREKVEAIMAYGREYLRQERERDAARLAALTSNPSNPEENCQPAEA